MKPNIRVERYQIAANTVSIGPIKWLTKWDVKIQFSNQDTAYAWVDKIENLLTGKQPTEREWVGLTDDEVGNLSDFAYANDEEFVRNVEKHLKEKNSG